MFDFEHLTRIAVAANADDRKWIWKGGYPQAILREGDVVLVAETFTDPDHTADFAEFISTFDPPTVLELLRLASLVSGRDE